MHTDNEGERLYKGEEFVVFTDFKLLIIRWNFRRVQKQCRHIFSCCSRVFDQGPGVVDSLSEYSGNPG